MKTLYRVETKSGLEKSRKNLQINQDGSVTLFGGLYRPNPKRARFRQYRAFGIFKRTVRIFPFREGDEETMPFFEEFAKGFPDAAEGKAYYLPHPKFPNTLTQQAMKSHKASMMLRGRREMDMWKWLAFLLAFGIILMGLIIGARR